LRFQVSRRAEAQYRKKAIPQKSKKWEVKSKKWEVNSSLLMQ
jgi:hypothetical protein